jgi:ankyrin repeat protein
MTMAKRLVRRRWTKLRKRNPPKLYIRLWNTWTKESDQANPQVDWEAVLEQVRRKPRITCYQDEERQGMLLLHLACALKPPISAINVILRVNPQAVGHKSITAGLLPLHIAVGRNADVAVVRRLIQQDPQALLIPDHNGHTVIAWACRVDVSKDLLRLLLEFNPSLAQRRTNKFGSPLEFVYRHRHYYKTAHAVPFWHTNQWAKLTYILWAAHYGTVVSPRNGQTLSTLHAALSLACPTHIIEDATSLHAQNASGIRDVHGNYPLHYAVRTLNASRQVLLKLLKYFPDAVSIRDNQLQLPLHEALKSGRTWEEGVKELYYAYPAAIAEQDSETCMLPVLLAAVHCDLTTIHALLREYPQVVPS